MTTDETAAKLTEWLNESALGEWSVFTKNAAGDQEIVAYDPNDEIPWTVAQFPPGEAFSDGIVLMKNTLPALLAEREAMKADIARLRGGLEDVANPIEHLRRYAESRGSKLNGGAYSIGNNLAFVQQIARDALQALPPGDSHCEHQSQPGPCSVCGDMG